LAQELGGPSETAGQPLPERLEDAIAVLSNTTTRWVMAPPAGPDLLRELATPPDAVTLVTGVDQAAIVAAYQMLKSIAGTLEASCHPPLLIEIAVVGTAGEDAAAALQRLQDTAMEQLDLIVHGGPCVPQIDAVVSCSRSGAWRIPNAHINELMAMLHGGSDLDVSDAEKIVATDPPAEPAVVIPATPIIAAESTQRRDTVFAVVEEGVEMGRVEEDAVRTAEPSGSSPEGEASAGQLAMHVPGLDPMSLACPDAPDVQWGRGSDGTLHVLAWHEQFRQITIARTWAQRNRSLVEQATSCRIDERLMAHLFTDVPLDVADLHTTDVALHVLSPVHVGGQVGWYSAPLNVPS
jgi:hypothetical protein